MLLCVFIIHLYKAHKKAPLKWVTIESLTLLTPTILSFALTLLEDIVPATPILLQFRSEFEK